MDKIHTYCTNLLKQNGLKELVPAALYFKTYSDIKIFHIHTIYNIYIYTSPRI